MGRARRRERLARQAAHRPGPPRPRGALPAGSAPPSAAGSPQGGQPDDGDRRLHDPQWRRAERRRIARLNRLPDPFRSWGDRSRAHAFAVGLLQGALVTVVGLTTLKLTTGAWLPAYAAVVVLALAVVSQAVCRSVNRRADERAGVRP